MFLSFIMLHLKISMTCAHARLRNWKIQVLKAGSRRSSWISPMFPNGLPWWLRTMQEIWDPSWGWEDLLENIYYDALPPVSIYLSNV